MQEVIHNQATFLEDNMAAHPPNAEVAPETEFQVDHNFVEALDVVLQEHKEDDDSNDHYCRL